MSETKLSEMRRIASQDVAKRSVPMTKSKYTPEIKERVVRLLLESEKDYPSTWAAITVIAPKIGCTPETLHAWHQKHLNQQNPVKVQLLSHQSSFRFFKYFCGQMIIPFWKVAFLKLLRYNNLLKGAFNLECTIYESCLL